MKELTSAEKTGLEEYYKTFFSRVNFNGGFYFNILKINLGEYTEYEKQIEEARKKHPVIKILETHKIQYKMQHYDVVAITFAAMFLECLIWDYAAVNTSQALAKDSLASMSLMGKWKVIPKLINNNNKIKIKSSAIFLLKKLVKERNKIVHSESKALSYDDFMEYLSARPTGGRSITAKEAHQCVIDCTEALKKIDTTDYWFFNIWDKYDKYKPHNPFG